MERVNKGITYYLGKTNPLDFAKILNEDVESILRKINKPKNVHKMHVVCTPIFKDNINYAIKLHAKDILAAILYSKEAQYKSPLTGETFDCMSGYFERFGKLPKSFDEINIIKGKDYFTVRHIQGERVFRSEFNFYVIPKNDNYE